MHAFERLLDDDIFSRGGRNSLFQLLAMLAVPGAFHSIYVALHYSVFNIEAFRSPLATMDRYGFLCYSMVVMGFAAVLVWEALFPDRRDYLTLTPLPLPVWSLFFAKLLALSAYVSLFGIAANVGSSVLFPLVSAPRSTTGAFLNIVAAHVVSVLAVGTFVALCLGAVHGILMSILPRAAFRVASEWTRSAVVIFLTTSILVLPALSFSIQRLVESNDRLLYILPPFWFLGLYEVMLPGTGHPIFYTLSSIALQALPAAAMLFLVTYLIGYRRHSRRVLEEPKMVAKAAKDVGHFLRSRPQEQAAYAFVDQTIRRSAKHRLCLSVFAGVAIGFSLLSAYSSGAVFVPFIL